MAEQDQGEGSQETNDERLEGEDTGTDLKDDLRDAADEARDKND
jgi:hypothetical protein